MRIPSTTTSMDKPVNLFRATTTCNTFYVFLMAAKAALFPFLTLFFKLIELTALQTGIIMAAKTLTGFLWAPLWARCAVIYNKRRLVLVFSLLMMGLMYLSFTAVYYKVGKPHSCLPIKDHQDGNATGGSLNGSSDSLPTTPQPGTTTTKGHDVPGVHPGSGVGNGSSLPGAKVTETPVQATDATVPGGGDTTAATEEEEDTSAPTKQTSPPSPTVSSLPGTKISKEEIEALGKKVENLTGFSLKEIKGSGLSAHDLYTNMKEFGFAENLTESMIEQWLKSSDNETERSRRSLSRHVRNLNFTFVNNLKDQFSHLTATLEEKKLLLFLVVLLIVIFGEFFSSPVEKIADDAWFDFLERIDDMEKYGRQRYWGSLTYALVPIVVTVLVDYTPCEMMFSSHHFLLHFYVFGVFVIFALFIAFYYPMPPPLKQKYTSKVGKGLRVVCCDGQGFLFVLTLLLAGGVYSSFNNFLFWRLQDLGSAETTMGLCVAIGAFAETPMLVFSNKLVRKLGHGGVVSLSLLVLALRVLYYGFLWTPWAVLPAELTNAFTHTAMWYAVLSYEEFNIGSAIDRSIRSILSSIYFGLGFSLGSFVSGLVYELYGASVLFWGASVVSAAWCLAYSLIRLCLPKKERVRYIKLLRKEDDDSSEGDDDWLEMALKDQ